MKSIFSFSEEDVINSLKEVGVELVPQTVDQGTVRMVTEAGDVHFLDNTFSFFDEKNNDIVVPYYVNHQTVTNNSADTMIIHTLYTLDKLPQRETCLANCEVCPAA